MWLHPSKQKKVSYWVATIDIDINLRWNFIPTWKILANGCKRGLFNISDAFIDIVNGSVAFLLARSFIPVKPSRQTDPLWKRLQTSLFTFWTHIDIVGICSILHLIAVMRLFIESDTMREWLASNDHVGGSLGFITNDRAVFKRWVELSSMERADWMIGSWAAEPLLIEKHKLTIKIEFLCSTIISHLTNLSAYLRRHTSKLGIGCKCGQIVNGFDERCGRHATLLTIFLREISIQSLRINGEGKSTI